MCGLISLAQTNMRLHLTGSILAFSCAAAFGGTNELYSDAASWTGQVYIAIMGDSIPAGGGAAGCGLGALPNAISNASGGLLTATNFGYGGSHWTNQPWYSNNIVYSAEGQITQALAVNPRWLFIDMGRNDVYPFINTSSNLTEGWPVYWPTISNAISWVRAKCVSQQTRLLLGEILPAGVDLSYLSPTGWYYQWGNITVTNYNAAYSRFCASNSGAYLCTEHDRFGATNLYNGQRDLLDTNYWNSYPSDNLHLNLAGFALWGPIIVSNLAGLFPDAPSASTPTLRAGTIRMP